MAHKICKPNASSGDHRCAASQRLQQGNSKNYLSLLVNRARMEGIVVFDYAERYHLAVAEMAGYLKDGRMTSREDVVSGLENFPTALTRLFTGENFGKLVLQVAAD